MVRLWQVQKGRTKKSGQFPQRELPAYNSLMGLFVRGKGSFKQTKHKACLAN
jgi:hypothetical protein